jgi:hypothetical protein
VSYEAAISVQRLKALGKKQGFLTHQQVNSELHPSVVDPEKIAAIVEEIECAGVRVVENPREHGGT